MPKKTPAPVVSSRRQPEPEPVDDRTDIEKFTDGFFAEHGQSVADVGFQAAECDCGEPGCTGFQMVHPHDTVHHYH